jgi:23S rRNA (cytidine1920-2'-O)/16S rRNA (cytidine1409-2'-O)-methyltransferase
MRKQRLDVVLAERGLFGSRTAAAAAVMAGEVHVGQERRRARKPGEAVAPDAPLSVAERPRYVSRGGLKLQNALAATGLQVTGRIALDVGASTGGFTDCLLAHGAARVVAVDVGYGELAYRLRTDGRVAVLERTNARNLTPREVLDALSAEAGRAAPDGLDAGAALAAASSPTAAPDTAAGPALPDMAVVDVSFISLRKVLPAVLGCLVPTHEVLALVKPQFEVGRERVGGGGVVRDAATRRDALIEVGLAAMQLGARVLGFYSSGLPGPKGNRESFVWLASAAGTAARAGGGGGDVLGAAGAAGGGMGRVAACGAGDVEQMARAVEP